MVRSDLGTALSNDLDELAAACRVLELEGHGDRIWGHMALRDPQGRGFWIKRAGEALLVGSSGFDWSAPDPEEIAAKQAAGIAIVNHAALWAYYRRKLARAEAAGDPRLGTAPVPLVPG